MKKIMDIGTHAIPLEAPQFYNYDQNNSGGGFVYDDRAGIAQYVIIEAVTAREANLKAEEIGLYFDGAGDCSCCGDRWYSVDDGDGTEAPFMWDKSLQEYGNGPLEGDYWSAPGDATVFVHYMDGRIEGWK